MQITSNTAQWTRVPHCYGANLHHVITLVEMKAKHVKLGRALQRNGGKEIFSTSLK